MRSIIIGAGTYGEVYLSYLQEAGIEIIGFIDDDPKFSCSVVNGVSVLGEMSQLSELIVKYEIEAAYCPIGNNKLRVKLLEKARNLNLKTPNYIHPSVTISPNVKIGEGVYILLGSMIMPHTIIQDFTMISMNVKIAHHSLLGKGAFLSMGVCLGANIHLKEFAYVGIGAVIVTGIKEIGVDSVIGAGAVVIRDVDAGMVVAGNPAKVLRIKNEYKE